MVDMLQSAAIFVLGVGLVMSSSSIRNLANAINANTDSIVNILKMLKDARRQ